MSLTRTAIEKNRITLVALAVVLLAGVGAYLKLPRAEDPGFVVRVALVLTYFPGASPARVEQLVTDKLEKVIQEMPEVDVITSQSKTGVSQITVEIKSEYTDLRPIWDDLRRKVEGARGGLPEEVRGPFVNDEFGEVFGVVVAITGDGFNYAELAEIAEEVRDELLLVPDVAKVEIYGAQDERIFVEYDNARLAELGLTPVQLQAILETANIIIPGGDVATAGEKIVLEPSGNFESIAALRQALIQLPGSAQLIALEDVATVHRGYVDPPQTMMRASSLDRSVPALGLAVSMREGGNIIDLGSGVLETLERVQSAYPVGVDFQLIQFQPDEVDKKVSDFVGNLLQAVTIVILVMLLSLGLRTGMVVASLIPMAIITTFLVMSLFGIGLDQMSLAALIIALGLLVDNAIVVSESIMVQMAAGKPAVEAAVDSAGELRIPLLVSSLTTAAAFLPIYLAESSVGEYTAPIFQVVTITLLSSWILSLTVIPLFCVVFLKVRRQDQTFDSPFYRRYRSLLVLLLRRPLVTMAVVAALFALSMWGFGFVPNVFFPPNDRPTFTVELELPTGTDIATTARVAERVEDFLTRELLLSPEEAAAGKEGIVNWATFVGRGAPRFVLSYSPQQVAPEYAIVIANASSRAAIDAMVPRIEAYCSDHFTDLIATVAPLQLGPSIDNPIEVRVSGRDEDRLFAIVDGVKGLVQQDPGTRNIGDDWGARAKKLRIEVDQARARLAGVTNQDVAISLQTMLSGFATTEYREEDKVIPVVMRSIAADRQDVGKIESLNVFAQATGRSVPLKQVADAVVAWEPSIIRRRNRMKTVTVTGGLLPGVTASEVNARLRPALAEQADDWGLGYSWELGGEAETSEESSQSIAEQLPVAGLIIILLLVGQFNSLRRPLIILITIPLGLMGVVVGLLVLRSYFGFMTLLGVVSLAGIVINNAIVLLDRIRIEIDENGLVPQRAIVESAQQRLRPILLTTMTTLGGLIPLYLGGGPMWEPMAVAIMFGLLFATALTLGVVPVLYALFFRVRFRGFSY